MKTIALTLLICSVAITLQAGEKSGISKVEVQENEVVIYDASGAKTDNTIILCDECVLAGNNESFFLMK
jgi:hypothetical protein